MTETRTLVFDDPARRRRLVRVCAAISGDAGAAEDLAQETLLEAWRHQDKLHDPAGADAWLAAIARNVCLRSARRQGRQPAVARTAPEETAIPDDLDLEVELERAELAELLDRALALLPRETREVLVQRYVHESPHAEIGERLGLSEDAVSMRLSRGKVSLRRLLASELAAEAEAFGLADLPDEGWRETRIWCSDCGARRLLARRADDPPSLRFRCPGCHPRSVRTECPLGNPTFAELVGRLVRPSAILERMADWAHGYFREGAAGHARCTRCGHSTRILRYRTDRDGIPSEGLYVACEACGEQASSSIRGVAHGVREVRAFRRNYARTRVTPERELELDGTKALAVRYEDTRGSAGVDVFFAHDTLRLLGVASD